MFMNSTWQVHLPHAPCFAGGTHRRTDDAVSAALETVLYAQMLVLFAPQAVPAKSHLPVLVRCVANSLGQEGEVGAVGMQAGWEAGRGSLHQQKRASHLCCLSSLKTSKLQNSMCVLQQPAVAAAAASQGRS